LRNGGELYVSSEDERFRLELVFKVASIPPRLFSFLLEVVFITRANLYFDSELAGDPEALREPGNNFISISYRQ